MAIRKELSVINDTRKTFRGIFIRFGEKKSWKGGAEKTVLIQKITESGNTKVLADHLWFNFTQSFADAGFLKEGDLIEFDARVKPYTKGYVNRQERIDFRKQDYKLSHPTKVKRISTP